MNRLLLCWLCCCALFVPGACVWLFHTSAVACAEEPPQAQLFVPSGAMSYYIPEQIGCAARVGGSSYGYHWVPGWKRDGRWYTRDASGTWVPVNPAEVRWCREHLSTACCCPQGGVQLALMTP